jgi:coenzyme F420 hydrogenase subunit beta
LRHLRRIVGSAIVFSDRTGKCLPKIVTEPEDKLTDLIWNACPGKEFSFPSYRKAIYPDSTPFHVYTGPYLQIGIGYSADESIRMASASGGILTAILCWLLEKKIIDGAVVTGMSEQEPWHPRSFIATTREELIAASQSKYVITSVNEILPEMERFNGKLAYVGLPGQVQSIRKLQALNHPSVKISGISSALSTAIHFISLPSAVSLNHTARRITGRSRNSISDMVSARQHACRNAGRQGYRVAEIPCQLPDPIHILKNSLLCTDLTNEFTDISGGDAWAPVYEERGKGFSMIIARSAQGTDILRRMQEEGYIDLQPVPLNEAITMHSHGYDLKKRGSFIRIRLRKLFGLPVPDYGYTLKGFPLSRYLMEIVILSYFGTWYPAGPFHHRTIPPSLVGRLFERSGRSGKNPLTLLSATTSIHEEEDNLHNRQAMCYACHPGFPVPESRVQPQRIPVDFNEC